MELFPAQLTDRERVEDEWLYAWDEWEYTGTGGKQLKTGGRKGRLPARTVIETTTDAVAPDAMADPPVIGQHQITTLTIKRAEKGTFTITWGGTTTAAIAWDASVATVQAALDTALGGSAPTVSGSAGSFVLTGGDYTSHAVTAPYDNLKPAKSHNPAVGLNDGALAYPVFVGLSGHGGSEPRPKVVRTTVDHDAFTLKIPDLAAVQTFKLIADGGSPTSPIFSDADAASIQSALGSGFTVTSSGTNSFAVVSADSSPHTLTVDPTSAARAVTSSYKQAASSTFALSFDHSVEGNFALRAGATGTLPDPTEALDYGVSAADMADALDDADFPAAVTLLGGVYTITPTEDGDQKLSVDARELVGDKRYAIFWSVGDPCTAPLAGIDPSTITGYVKDSMLFVYVDGSTNCVRLIEAGLCTEGE